MSRRTRNVLDGVRTYSVINIFSSEVMPLVMEATHCKESLESSDAIWTLFLISLSKAV